MRGPRAQWAEAARRHPFVASATGALGAAVLASGIASGKPVHAAVYLAAMFLAVAATDLVFGRPGFRPDPLPVRSPRAESLLALACTAVGAVVLLRNFHSRPQPGPGLLLHVALLLLFSMPIALAAALLLRRYSPRALGVRLRGIGAALPAFGITGAAALVAAPEGMFWDDVFAAGFAPGLGILLLQGLVGAALPEEFLRLVLQTRLGAWWRNPAAGWLAASVLWAALHLPQFATQGHGFRGAALGVLHIVPLGLMWGYLTHRTKSLVPALLVHGANLWGLQNL